MANWNNDQDRYNNRFNDEDFNYEGGYGRRNFNRDYTNDFDRGNYGQGMDQWSNMNRGYNTDYNRSFYGRDYDYDMNYNRGYYNRGFYGRGNDYNRGYGYRGGNPGYYGGGFGYGGNYTQYQGGYGGNQGYYGAGNQGNYGYGYGGNLGGYGYGSNQGNFGGYQGGFGGSQGYFGSNQGNFGGGYGYGNQGNFDQDYGWEGDYGLPYDYTYTEYWLIPGPETGNGPQGYQRSDNRILEDVCDRLAQHGRIDAREITVDVKNGEVTLTGTVYNRNSKRMAEDVVESVMGVADVHNNLKVKHENKQIEGRQSSGQKSMTGTSSRRSLSEKSGSSK